MNIQDYVEQSAESAERREERRDTDLLTLFYYMYLHKIHEEKRKLQ